MNKLHTFAFYALVTPAITFSSAAVLAQQTTGQDANRDQPSTQSDRGATPSATDRERQSSQSDRNAATPEDTQSQSSRGATTPGNTQSQGGRDATTPGNAQSQSGRSADRAGQSDQQTAAERRNMREDSRMEHRGYMNAAPMNGIHISDLMEAEVTTTGDEDVGSVDDLIIDEDGQVVAIVVGVGGFLGMGQKDVAIGWDDVTRSGASDQLELRIDSTRDDLRSAPEFERNE